MSLKTRLIEEAKKEEKVLKRRLEGLVESVFSKLDLDTIESFEQDVRGLCSKYSRNNTEETGTTTYKRSKAVEENYQRVEEAIKQFGGGVFISRDIAKITELSSAVVGACLRYIPDVVYNKSKKAWRVKGSKQILDKAIEIYNQEGSVSVNELKKRGIITQEEVKSIRRVLNIYASQEGWKKEYTKGGVKYLKD